MPSANGWQMHACLKIKIEPVQTYGGYIRARMFMKNEKQINMA
jgi:hypothetical protein